MKSSLYIAIACFGFVAYNLYLFIAKTNNVSLVMSIIWLGICFKHIKQYINQK